MRRELLFDPLLLLERIGEICAQKRRLRKLQKTPARSLNRYHIDSLELLELLKSPKPIVVFDVGANVGTWTVLAKSIHPTCEVHAFEPIEQHHPAFINETKGFDHVFLHPIGLGSSVTRKTMKIASTSDASSFLSLTEEGKSQWNLKTVGEQQLEIYPLDDWCARKNLPMPDLIKMDVQGYELEVLKGAHECLKNATAVLTEVSFIEFYQDQCLFSSIVEHLRKYGYELHALGFGTPLGKRLFQTDALFVQSKTSKCEIAI